MTDHVSVEKRSGFSGLSIASKIVLVATIFVTVIGILAGLTVQRIVLRGLELTAEDKAVQVAERIVRQVDTTRSFTQSSAFQTAMTGLDENAEFSISLMNDTLDQFILVSGGNVLSAIVVDVDGNIVTSVPEAKEVSMEEIFAQPWFDTTVSGETYLASNLEMDGITDIDGFHVSVPILNTTTNERVGTFYVIYSDSSLRQPPELIGISSASEEPARREFAVYDSNGEVIIPGLSSAPSADVISGLGPTMRSTTSDGNMYTFVSLADVTRAALPPSASGWRFIAGQPAALTAGSFTTPATLLQLFLIVRTILIIATIAIVAYVFLNPLRTLMESAVRVRRQGAYNIPLNAPGDASLLPLVGIYNAAVQLRQQQQEQVEAAVQVSENSTASEDLNLTLEQVVDLAYERFGFRAVRCYLTDNAQTSARLVVARGSGREAVGSQVIAVNDRSLIGRAIALQFWQQGVIEGTRDAAVAIPMVLSGQALGVLVFVSRQTLPSEQISVLRLLTNQVAVFIENARLLRQSAVTLDQIEALNRRLTREGWENYLGTESVIRHTLDPFQRWPALPEHNPGTGKRTTAQTYTDHEGREVIAVPLILRGEGVGAISATRPPGELWTREEISLIESIAARMVVIADSIRLVDEASRRASREELVNELSAQMLSRSASVESVLQTALSELGGALSSDRIALRIGAPDMDIPQLVPDKAQDDDPQAEQDDVHPPSMNGGSV